MKHEKSCGAVLFTESETEIRYVIVKSLEGFHGFPKGHMETGETEEETAKREIFEETGILPQLIYGFRAVDEHPSAPDTMKQIVYFLAQYSNQNIIIQKSEILQIDLLTYDEAISIFEYESSKRILKEANDFLLSISK